jgi:PDZ domain-containing protein/aspartyl protease
VAAFRYVAFACNAAALLAQLAAATGGSSWSRSGEISAYGRLLSSGLLGVAEIRYDLRSGRYAKRFVLPVAGERTEVYDGRIVWSRDISGGVHPYDAWYPRARAVTDAYLIRRGYASSDAATFSCLPGESDGDRRLDRVRVLPRGGVPAVLSIDARTHLLDSVAIRTPITTDVMWFSDYRQAGSLVLPFGIASGSLFEPANADRIAVTRYSVTRDVNAAHFQKPVSAPNARMLDGVQFTTVPAILEGRQLLVWASINGHVPMPFILDTGGHAILDSVGSKMLGLQGAGSGVSGGAGAGTIGLQYTRVASVRIGKAVLYDQPFLIIPYPYSFYERGRRAPLAGILGLEWFERFAARVDYSRQTLTLTPLARFHPSARATPVAIRFQEDMPLAPAAADGHAGEFGVDTGNAGLLILYGDFLQRTGLLAKYAPGYTVRGQGTGGGNTGRVQKLRAFNFGGSDLANIDADFTQMKTGAFSSWTEAGDLGLSVLSRFTPAFDYASETLYLESVKRPYVTRVNRSGLGFTKNEAGAIDVVAVRPGSVAAALGIVAGDRIVAVNGKPAADLSSADFLEIVTASSGTAVTLTVQHGAAERAVRLMLR